MIYSYAAELPYPSLVLVVGLHHSPFPTQLRGLRAGRLLLALQGMGE
jgi:hypothetical protein